MSDSFADQLWRLILADEPETKAKLEALCEASQAEAVDHMIEETCWHADVPELVGHRGTMAERLMKLRAAYAEHGPS